MERHRGGRHDRQQVPILSRARKALAGDQSLDLQNQGAQFGLIDISLGQTPRPDIERKVLDEVGSYGRQLGWIGDALEGLTDHVKLETLTPGEADAIRILRGQLAVIPR